LVAKGLRPNVVVAEGLQCGISEHHMRRPGTLSLSPGVFLAVLGDLIDSVVRAGFRNVAATTAPAAASGIRRESTAMLEYRHREPARRS
jgi:creatinine amidohydrolase